MKKYCLFITFTYTIFCQQAQFDTSRLPSDATTDSIKSVVNELLEAISTNDSTKAAQLVLKEGHVMPPGYQSVVWNTNNNLGISVSAGIYFYQIQTKEFIKTKKMVILK